MIFVLYRCCYWKRWIFISFLPIILDYNFGVIEVLMTMYYQDCIQVVYLALDHFSVCACHPYARVILIFSVTFQFYNQFLSLCLPSYAGAMLIFFVSFQFLLDVAQGMMSRVLIKVLPYKKCNKEKCQNSRSYIYIYM